MMVKVRHWLGAVAVLMAAGLFCAYNLFMFTGRAGVTRATDYPAGKAWTDRRQVTYEVTSARYVDSFEFREPAVNARLIEYTLKVDDYVPSPDWDFDPGCEFALVDNDGSSWRRLLGRGGCTQDGGAAQVATLVYEVPNSKVDNLKGLVLLDIVAWPLPAINSADSISDS